MTTPLNDEERALALRYLGYPNWESLASSVQLGFPAESQPEYLIRDAFDRIASESLNLIREDICQLRAIEAQKADARSRLKATALGNLKLNPREMRALDQELAYWTKRLADDLGGYINPFSNFSTSPMAGGISAKVINS